MSSRVAAALEIFQNQGAMPLAKQTSLFVAKQTSIGRRVLWEKSLPKIRARMAEEQSLDDILDTVLDREPGYRPYQITTEQLRDEIKPLATLVKQEQPKTVLEIGTANGGSFYIWSRYLDSVDSIVSLDLPGGRFGGGYTKRKIDIFRELAPSKEMVFVRGNSHQQNTYDEVSAALDSKVDFLFIDGDHTYHGVKRDFEMYRDLVADGGLIALHDIATHPDERDEVQRRRQTVSDIENRHLLWGEFHPDCNVDRFWDEVTAEYETDEIISHPKQTWAGIGVVRV